jgi:7,8-dihydropterin-6-yl-methyl-4-(beta-D-ribofuranosyl)aminobenzene 5'-phosphate synthase
MKSRPRLVILFAMLAALFGAPLSATPEGSNPDNVPAQIHALKVTVLSTMLVGDVGDHGDRSGRGEWGFSALIETDGHRILLDTGAHPETVLQNARDLKIDLSDVNEVILTHNHWDHVRGLMTLRREMMKKNPAAFSVVHVAKGIFYSRPSPKGEDNDMIAIRKEYEATGGKFIEHSEGADIFPGAWLTGPVPRKYPERNWSVSGKVQMPDGLVEDNIPEDQSLVLNTTRPGGGDWLRTRGHRQYFDVRGHTLPRPARVWRRRRAAPLPRQRRAGELDRRQDEGIQGGEHSRRALHGPGSGVPAAGPRWACAQFCRRGQRRFHLQPCRGNSSRSAGQVIRSEQRHSVIALGFYFFFALGL